MANSPVHLLDTQSLDSPDLFDRVKNRALGLGSFDFQPYSCFIEYKAKETRNGLEYRDCIVDYTKCTNQSCIKKLV